MTSIDTAVVHKIEQLVRHAGDRIIEMWPARPCPSGSRALKIERKADGSFVTEADYVSNEILIEGIQELFPEDGIISEERPVDPSLHDLSRVWIVDPLDGTKAFIEGREEFAVLLSLAVNGSAEFGIMYYPALKKFAVADQGGGARMDWAPLHVSGFDECREEGVYVTGFDAGERPCLLKRKMDSGLAMLAVCNGELDGFIQRINSPSEWDFAAPAAVIEESGGRISDEKGQPLRFNQPNLNYQYVLASNGRVHDQLMGMIP